MGGVGVAQLEGLWAACGMEERTSSEEEEDHAATSSLHREGRSVKREAPYLADTESDTDASDTESTHPAQSRTAERATVQTSEERSAAVAHPARTLSAKSELVRAVCCSRWPVTHPSVRARCKLLVPLCAEPATAAEDAAQPTGSGSSKAAARCS